MVSTHDHKNTAYPNREKGSSIILVVVTIAVLIGFVSYAIDFGMAYVNRARLQVAVDSAAYASVNLLPQLAESLVTTADVYTEAYTIAAANGVSASELTAISSPQIGNWNFCRNTSPCTPHFSPATTPYNAIRVTARRVMPIDFGKIFGFSELRPNASSVAALDYAGSTDCVIPLGVEDSLLEGLVHGDVLNLLNITPGNWGKLDIGGNMSSRPNFIEAMTSGNCGAPVSVGDQVNPGTGYAGVTQGFNERIALNPRVIMPVVEEFFNGGSSDVVIAGFIHAELIADQRNGHNWTGEIRFLGDAAGATGGGSGIGAGAQARVLVE